ncbi:MAG: hypothetical protein H7308_14135 [Chthonomonadaceae bacterium]|nr:hypothetical protein [Chthonomonadaceae bacterium]
MTETFHLHGFIRDVRYKTFLSGELPNTSADLFDINVAPPSGIIQAESGQVAYSKWVSPKRTRSYPFARLYNTFNAPSRLTIIPVIKDEGLDGDMDCIQYDTISWMNLLNIYVVLGFYDDAVASRRPAQVGKQKLTSQRLNTEGVSRQIEEIFRYKQSALHWNRSLMEERFVSTFRQALSAYEEISKKRGVAIHSQTMALNRCERIATDYAEFREGSRRRATSAAVRETGVSHRYEWLTGGDKCLLTVENYLGGQYHLTVDEVFQEEGRWIIQESKNSKDSALPSLEDIKDGLFKLILYSNIHTLSLNDQALDFTTRLCLTGTKLTGKLSLPATDETVKSFIESNAPVLKTKQRETLCKLNLETQNNSNLTAVVSGNTQ